MQAILQTCQRTDVHAFKHMNTSKLTVLTTDQVCLAARASDNVSLLSNSVPLQTVLNGYVQARSSNGREQNRVLRQLPCKTTPSIKDPMTLTRIGARRRQIPPQRGDHSHAQQAIR